MNIEQHKKDWFEENAPIGRELGYPDCCIKEFCDSPPILLKNRKPGKDDKRRLKASFFKGEYSGFIPCSEHAKQIVQGKITLDSLIKNRSEKFRPFPHL